jgi:NAD(P)-dependent dehydrogenase (short-subunit alcohol dehydrogenase family)
MKLSNKIALVTGGTSGIGSEGVARRTFAPSSTIASLA